MKGLEVSQSQQNDYQSYNVTINISYIFNGMKWVSWELLKMNIRKATEQETCYILDHSLEVMEEATMGKVKPLKEKAEKIMVSTLLEGGYYLVFVENEDICGWIGIGQSYDFYSGEVIGMIPELYVLPKYRKQGIAKKLCKTACERFKHEGYNSVQLNVFAGNGAKKLYEKLGFEDISILMGRQF